VLNKEKNLVLVEEIKATSKEAKLKELKKKSEPSELPSVEK
jgi:hypothetical protein